MTVVEPITDEMCSAALAAERSRAWHSDELRVWAMLAAARDASTAFDGEDGAGPTALNHSERAEPDDRKGPA